MVDLEFHWLNVASSELPVRIFRVNVCARGLWVLAPDHAQMICLLAALTWYGRLLHKGLTLALRGQIAAVNSQVVGELAEFLSEWHADRIQPGSEELRRNCRPWSIASICRTMAMSLCWTAAQARYFADPASWTKTVIRRFMPIGNSSRPRSENSGPRERSAVGSRPPLARVTSRSATCPKAGVLLVADQREDGMWAAMSYISAPLWTFGVMVVVVLVLLGTIFSMLIIHRYENALEWINSHLEQMIAQRSRALLNTRDAVIYGLAKLADSRDADTGEHVDRVREYAGVLARQLSTSAREVTEEYIERLKLASSLHDIGKVGIRDEILLKPGRLTPDERKIIQTHSEIGVRCLAAIQRRLGDDDFLEMACEIAASHHERWDGLGYPFGLQANEIPLSRRIVAVADVYDALTTHRVYRDAISHAEATKMILDGAGTQFDPAVVAAFRACQDAFQHVAQEFSAEGASRCRV